MAVFLEPVTFELREDAPKPVLNSLAVVDELDAPERSPKKVLPEINSILPACILLTLKLRSLASVVPKKLRLGLVPELPLMLHALDNILLLMLCTVLVAMS